MRAMRLLTLVGLLVCVSIFTALWAQDPSIILASTNPAIPAANVMAGTPNHPIYRFTLTADGLNAQFNTLNFVTSGTYLNGDIINLKLWTSLNDDISTATQIFELYTLNFGAGAQNFNNINQSLLNGNTYYYWITADIELAAGQGRTICVLAIDVNDLNFDVAEKTGIAYDGGCQTFDGVLPVELSTFTAVVTAQNFVALNWTSQTESNLSGYYVFRNTSSDLQSGMLVSPLIGATNTSQTSNYTFVDEEVDPGNTYYYWLQSLDLNGEYNFHGPLNVTLTQGGDTTPPEIPLVTQLRDAFPNPFSTVTKLSYSLKAAGTVKIEVYNMKGQMIWSNTQSHAKAGYYDAAWNGKDLNGTPVSSGIYSYTMTSGNYTSSKKVVLVK